MPKKDENKYLPYLIGFGVLYAAVRAFRPRMTIEHTANDIRAFYKDKFVRIGWPDKVIYDINLMTARFNHLAKPFWVTFTEQKRTEEGTEDTGKYLIYDIENKRIIEDKT